MWKYHVKLRKYYLTDEALAKITDSGEFSWEGEI
jgi:hypothetical protein